MYGDCSECGFPVLLKDANVVECPFCKTLNQPISSDGVSLRSAAVALATVIGLIVLSKVGK